MTLNMWIASCAWLLLVLGYGFRSRRDFHVPLVLAGILLDVGLVGYLQLTRDAVQTALEFKLGAFQQLHIGASTTALVLYPVVVITGVRMLSTPSPRLRSIHRRFALTALGFRTAGFILMFSM